MVRDPGSVARTIWLPFQVWVTGTRWMAPVGEAVANHTLAPTAVSFDRASALRSSGDRVTMLTAWHGCSRGALEKQCRITSGLTRAVPSVVPGAATSASSTWREHVTDPCSDPKCQITHSEPAIWGGRQSLMQGIRTADGDTMVKLGATGWRQWLATLSAVVAMFALGIGVSGCSATTANQSVSTSSLSPESSAKTVCADFNAYSGAISAPPTVQGNPRDLLAKLVKAGTSALNATLVTEVKALGKATASGLGANFGPAWANSQK